MGSLFHSLKVRENFKYIMTQKLIVQIFLLVLALSVGSKAQRYLDRSETGVLDGFRGSGSLNTGVLDKTTYLEILDRLEGVKGKPTKPTKPTKTLRGCYTSGDKNLAKCEQAYNGGQNDQKCCIAVRNLQVLSTWPCNNCTAPKQMWICMPR